MVKQMALPESTTADLSNINQSLLQLTLSDKDFKIPKRKGGGKGGGQSSGQGPRGGSKQGHHGASRGMAGASLPPISDKEVPSGEPKVNALLHMTHTLSNINNSLQATPIKCLIVA